MENELKELLRSIAVIPAPSGYEDKRVEFIAKWLEKNRIDFSIDSAKNIIIPFGKPENLTVFLAHTDVVFPDTEPLPFYEENGKIFNPGIGDNTVHVAQLLFAAKELKKADFNKNILIVLNSCEEGLGNLKGIKQIMDDYKGKVKQVISIDGQYGKIVNKCVGSERYKIIVKTTGGHSFGDFGNDNAIHKLAEIITELYKIKIPVINNSKTTFNVGIISGGTSVNTIAQYAEMMYEYRSDEEECIAIMRNEFDTIIKTFKSKGTDISVEVIGIRPCAKNVDKNELDKLTQYCEKICKETINVSSKYTSGSTDSNIPMSMGIPSVTIGGYIGGGPHTREEWLETESIYKGYKFVYQIINFC